MTTHIDPAHRRTAADSTQPGLPRASTSRRRTIRRGTRLAVSLALASSIAATSLAGPLATSAHAMSRRCEVLYHYMANKSPDGADGWMWRAASVEYMNYC